MNSNSISPEAWELLRGAYDAHVHTAPDSPLRSQNAAELLRDAREAGMAGIVLKGHAFPTAYAAANLNALHAHDPQAPVMFGSVTLNPAVGGVNPLAVKAALDAGATVVWMPTTGSRRHVELWGKPAPYPQSPQAPEGMVVRRADGSFIPEVDEIIDLIRQHDAVLATGHLDAPDALELAQHAIEKGLKRMWITHASEQIPGMTYEQQHQAIALGAWVEHSLLAATPHCPGNITIEEFAGHLKAVGPERVVLDTDFGQPGNGPIVAGFARHLHLLLEQGIPAPHLRMMISENPRALLTSRQPITTG